MNKKQRKARIKYLHQEQERNTNKNAVAKQMEKTASDPVPEAVKHDSEIV
jgi:hypothetical protein